MQKTEEQKTKELERLKTWLKKLLPEQYDKIDVTAYYDSTLNYTENQGILRDLVKSSLKDLKEKAEEAIADQERLDKERIAAAEKEAKEWNDNLEYVDNQEVEGFYHQIYRSVDKICQGYSNLAFIKGRGGIGKSRNIRKALIKQKADYLEVTGEVTEAYLYRLIFENNGKIIWLKDIVKLLSGQGCLPFYTTVMTNNGVKEIKDIDEKKDKVASWNFEKNQKEFKKFCKWKTGLKKVVKIKTPKGALECSPEHHWIVKDKKGNIVEKKAKNIKIEDTLLSLK